MKTVLNQLEKWILDYEKVNGTPTMCEIKAQLEMFKEVEKEQIIEAATHGANFDKSFFKNAQDYYDSTFGYKVEEAGT